MAEEAFILLDRKIAREFQKQAVSTKEYPMDFGEMWNLKSDHITKYNGINRRALLEAKGICRGGIS